MDFRKGSVVWKPFANLPGFVALLLLVDWDPIGILGYRGAMDEYDNYVAGVCELLQAGVSREDLIAHLNGIETQSMEMRGKRPAQEAVADKLLMVYKRVVQNESWTVE